MEGLLPIIAINGLVIAVFYAIFGLPVRRYAGRIKVAAALLEDTSLPEGIGEEFLKTGQTAARSASWQYGWAVVGLIVVLFIGFSIYAVSQAPGAELMTWVILSGIIYGVALIGCSLVASKVYACYRQVVALNQMLDSAIAENPQSVVLTEAKESIRLRSSELGGSAVTLAAVVGSVLVGAGYLVFFYAAAQTAIECARSSKCL